MKHLFLINIVFLLANTFTSAQSVTNVRFEQSGKQIVIYYDLEAKSGNYDTSLFYNLDNGKTWHGPLKMVTGDIGRKQIPGKNKKIIWDVKEEVSELQGFLQFRIDSREELNIEMILIQEGTFIMGCLSSKEDQRPVHYISLDKFYLGKYEVTNGQFCHFLNDTEIDKFGNKGDVNLIDINDPDCQIVFNGSSFVPKPNKENYPVVEVTWYGAQAFCNNEGGRLPTEAEWEYAAKKCLINTTASTRKKSNYAWIYSNSVNQTHPVGQTEPNNLGIYDLLGNVWEWCSDWYNESYYSDCPSHNPTGPASGSNRLRRGGSWLSSLKECNATERSSYFPLNSFEDTGFRMARDYK